MQPSIEVAERISNELLYSMISVYDQWSKKVPLDYVSQIYNKNLIDRLSKQPDGLLLISNLCLYDIKTTNLIKAEIASMIREAKKNHTAKHQKRLDAEITLFLEAFPSIIERIKQKELNLKDKIEQILGKPLEDYQIPRIQCQGWSFSPVFP